MRRRPYTETGIARVPCSIPGCTHRGRFQWDVRLCAIGGPHDWRALCVNHDVALNRAVLQFFGVADVGGIIERYRHSIDGSTDARPAAP